MEIFVDKKSGRIDAPFFTLLTVETVQLPDTVPDGMTVAILTPAGETLAMGHASGGAVVLDSNTLQAAGYFGDAPVGASKNAFIVIGETNSLLAIIPVLVRENPLDRLAPPSAMAPAYPTTAELRAILDQVQAAAKEATEAARTVAEDTVEALRAELEKTLGQFKAVAGQIESNKAVIVDYVDNKLPAAANKIVQEIEDTATTASTALDNKLSAAQTALDGKVSAANNAATDADGSAKAAKKSRDDAEAAKGLAADSAKNAATSATNAQTSEQNAKASAVQAENATALKVDKRINTADDSEFPVLIREDKDTYKFLSPHFSVPAYTRFWCDGIYYYFGNYSNYFGILVYDRNLKFVRYIKCDLGSGFIQSYADTGFCTKIGDHYFLRYYPRYASNFQIRKLNESGTLITTLEVSCAIGFRGLRVLRNERNNHLLVFGIFPEVADDGSAVSRVGYNVYDETLTSQSDTIGGVIKKGTINADLSNLDNWFNFLNITGNTIFVAFADKDDATKTALYYLDENDDLVPVGAIRGKGAFTVGGETRDYFVPRFFYNQRNQYTKYHEFVVCNGEKYHRVRIGYEETNRYEILTDQGSYAISKETVPSSRYGASSFFTARGNGGTIGGESFSMPYVICTKTGVIYRSADNGISEGVKGYTDYAIAPCMLSSDQFNHRAIGNSCIVDDNSPVPRTHLYPVGSYGQIGGAIMFTV